MKILHSLTISYRAFQSAWQSVPVLEQTIQNLTTRLIGEEALTRNINKGEMDPADVVFFPGQTPPASDVAFHAPRGRGGGYSSFRRGSRGFRRRGGGSSGTTSTIVSFSCDQKGHKSYNCPSKRTEERKHKGMRSSTRAAPPLDVSRRHSVSSQDNRIFGSWIQPRPVT
jgi:hypothetical protein